MGLSLRIGISLVIFWAEAWRVLPPSQVHICYDEGVFDRYVLETTMD